MKTFWFQDKRRPETYTVAFVETKLLTVVRSFFRWRYPTAVITTESEPYLAKERAQYYNSIYTYLKNKPIIYQ